MNKKYIVYVLGPMRGKRLFNFPAFDEMAASLEGAGHKVYNPAQLDRDALFNPAVLPRDWDWSTLPPGFNMQETIKRDVEVILKCDAYVCLDGWEKSTGATAEQKLLVWMGATRLDPVSLKPWVETKPEISDGNPKDACGLKKTPLRLIPWVSIVALARVMQLGANKYGEANWRDKKPRITVYVEAAMRHLLAYLDGQNIDPESGESHLAHAMANAAILLDAESCDCLLEDRKPTGQVIKALEGKPTARPASRPQFVSVAPKPFSVANE